MLQSATCACFLQAARKAGKLWAKLVYFALSPLLALLAVCTVFCLIARGSFAGSAAMTASWVAWPLVKAWSQLKSATSWLHPSKAPIHVVLLLAREPLYSHSVGLCHEGRIHACDYVHALQGQAGNQRMQSATFCSSSTNNNSRCRTSFSAFPCEEVIISLLYKTYLHYSLPSKFCSQKNTSMPSCGGITVYILVHTFHLQTCLCCSGVSTKHSWVKYLSSGLLLWWSLNGGWMAVVTTLLASIVSFIFCVGTLGTPVACKLSHVALTNTYITGYLYRAIMVVRATELQFSLSCHSPFLPQLLLLFCP